MKKIITSALMIGALSASSVSTYAIYDMNNPDSISDGWHEMMILNATSPAPMMYKEYSSQDAFENAEGYICKSATDGVNTFMMSDGEAGASTRIGYPEDFTPTWKCKSYIADEIAAWSQSDKNEYNTLLDRVSDAEMKKINTTIDKVDMLLLQFPVAKRDIVLDTILEYIDTTLFNIVLSYPQDIALPDDVYPVYNMLRLLRYELMLQN